MALLAALVILLVPLIALALYGRARPILAEQSLAELLTSSVWHPLRGAFGFLPFIMGTLWVTAVAMIIAVPPSLLTAVYLTEYASTRVHDVVMPFIDLLAGIPSVVYGVWGMLTVVPFVGDYAAPFLSRYLGFIPLFQSENPTGYGVLAGGLVLAVMTFPVIIAVTGEVLGAVPQGLREASWSLGATCWQTTRRVVLRRALPGVVAAVVLGFSRAFGETMAVLMVVGNVVQVPHSIFDAAYPLTALIANNYGEMMSIPLYDAALLCAALVLMLVVLVFNVISRLVLSRLARQG
ncbi:MAG: phosphate ABC transporter permease subunit PstC [Ardenticatenaceae bacterium]|nr:phosphate ABC transporter permease subunit PstC [Ardenticatenaceae bacterium]MCB9444163.1 phosphate ABC transporter permease subunit PstC [Ardenticatenaceae bacterium]